MAGTATVTRFTSTTATRQASRRSSTRLCNLAGTPRGDSNSNDFRTAIRETRRAEIEEGKDPATIYSLARRALGFVEHHGKRVEKSAERPAEKQEARRVLYVLTLSHSASGILGLVIGDECNVYAADDLKPGDDAAIELSKDAEVICGRVVSADAKQITIRDDDSEQSYNRAEIFRVGRIDNLNPAKIDPLTREQRARVKKLQSDLAALDKEDDQIIRCTRRYELEREIFDITHPVDAEDWSAWKEADDAE